VDVRVRRGPIHEVLGSSQAVIERIGETARLGAPEELGRDFADLPTVDAGLARLRIDREQDSSRRFGDGIEHVDRRVHHLAPAPVEVDLAEDGDLGTLGDPRSILLVEEGELQVRRAVVDLHLHDRATLSGPPHRDFLHLPGNSRLLLDRQRRDLRGARAVVVAARVVLEQVEHGVDPHRAEAFAEARADRPQL